MSKNLKKLNIILLIGLFVVASIFVTGCVERRKETTVEPREIIIGFFHKTDGGGYRAILYNHTRADVRFSEGVLVVTGASGDLREYLRLAIARGKIERGTIFSYNHREVTQLLERARPLIAEFPDRYPLRTEFRDLRDPAGEIHTVWVDGFVIIYNPKLIDRANVPKTLKDLANFNQSIGVPTTGCIGTWGTVALYHHLGENDFTTLMGNARVRGSMGDVTLAVRDGRVAVGLSSLLDTRVRDGEVGIVWPEEGAIAKPGILAIPNNATKIQLELADFLMSQENAALYASKFNMASALPNGPVPQIVRDNNFNFVFIPWADMANTTVAARVDAIIAR